MKLIKFLTVLAMVLISLFLVSCNGDSSGKKIDYNFKQGYSGLELGLLNENFFSRVYEKEPFEIIVNLDNQAAYDVTEGKITILGLDNNYFQMDSEEQEFQVLSGKSLTYPSGESQELHFEGRSTSLLENEKEKKGDFLLKVNYKSTMEFVDPKTCLNPNWYKIGDGGMSDSGGYEGCRIETKSYSGQGAPLAVTKMEEKPSLSENMVKFELMLDNKGRGASKGRLKRVTLGEASLGGKELSCRIKGFEQNQRTIDLKAEKQEFVVLCERVVDLSSSYETAMIVNFAYEYEIKEQYSLTLVK